MAITDDRPLELPSGDDGHHHQPLGVYTRPRSTTGWKSWFTTIDHKRIGIMYGVAAMFWFVVGGLEALLIRLQLAGPNGTLLNGDQYNQVFTMHGTTMVFLVVMPIGAAVMNYFMPLQIGARDVAFPRLNAFGFWAFFVGGIVLNSAWFLGGAADCGWFCYSPNSGVAFSPTNGVDLWNTGLLITGIASLSGAINLVVTTINLRAPGMSMMRMPVFTWMGFVTQLLLLFAIPVLTAAQFLLLFDRIFDANFFNVAAGADPLLWEHLFWIFGHPEVYILILPAFGVVSEILPVFSRKPIFGYPFIVFSGVAIGFMGWGVWAHHMFASGIGPLSVTAFSLSTMFIAVPTGVKILNWMATMWGGKLKFDTPMLFAVGLVGMFTIGGLSGVTHAVAPADTQQTDTYYIVAHFHYVLFGGAFLGFMGGFYYWWPKVFGHMLNDRIGKVNFWLMLVGFNLTFGPMHILGLQGMPRRIPTYAEGMGFDTWNLVATIGAFTLASSVALFLFNVGYSRRTSPPAPPDPWDGRTLEWMIPSPAPEHNFDEVPQVSGLDEFWHRKYADTEDGHSFERIASTDDVVERGDAHVHLPSPSYWPMVVAFGLPFVAWGLVFSLWLCAIGGAMVLAGIYGWGLEPQFDPDADADEGDGNGDGRDGDGPDGDEAGAASATADIASESEAVPVD